MAAALGSGGIRLYDRERGWGEAARDEDYGDQSYGAAFAADGRLATTSLDGKVRLYAAGLQGTVRPAVAIYAPDGGQPYGIAFSPTDGARLAIGYNDGTVVSLLDGHSLAPLRGPDVTGITGGDLSKAAWSADGRTLFAAGTYQPIDSPQVLAWGEAGTGKHWILPAGQRTVMSLVPLPHGDLLVTASDPWLGRLRPDGTAAWAHRPPNADYRGHSDNLSASADGFVIDFGFEAYGRSPARFDLAARSLTRDPPRLAKVVSPRLTGLAIEDWEDTSHPTLGGRRLTLGQYEVSRSLAIHPAGDRFVLGAEWSLRLQGRRLGLVDPAGSRRGLGGEHHRRRPAGGGRVRRWHDPLAPDERRR
jgi:hypothetical protein